MAPEPKRRKLNYDHMHTPSSSKKKDSAVAGDLAAIAQASSPTLHSSALAAAVGGEPSPSTRAPETVAQTSTSQVSGTVGDGFFSHSSNFSVNNSIMFDNSTRTTINISSDERRKAMKRLSKHIIPDADRDSSAREPVPRCHPGTRVDINGDIITWFYDEGKDELLLWIVGPAGVGKSAIMQTLADKLAEAQELGASVFISRPNKRNSSRHLFLTVGYQLAVRIEEYCAYITEKLARDPELVNKGIEVQFKTFIVEPFVDKKIGAGLKPWGILLDGLDELDELESQKQIIHLVAAFVLKHPDVPLLWAISSRPESHITDTFREEEVIPSYWRMDVPANSWQSIRDVELFIRNDLDRIRRVFPRRVPKEWPSEEQISKLAAAASGLFIFAQTALRFIEDPRHANPTTRLNQVLSALSGPITPSSSQPFVHLDALYSRILEDIPNAIWPITERVLGVLLAAQKNSDDVLETPAGIAVILGLEVATVYTAFNGCYSLLNVSDTIFDRTLFYHASFSDYLLDPIRAQKFCISVGDVQEGLLKLWLGVWENFKGNHTPTSDLTYRDRWIKYFSTIIPEQNKESYESCIEEFHESLISYIHEALVTILVKKHDPNGMTFSSEEDQDQCFNLLSQLEYGSVRDILSEDETGNKLWPWLFDMWEAYHDTLVSRGIITAMRLEQFQISHAEMDLGRVLLYDSNNSFRGAIERGLYANLRDISHLQSYHPQLPVLSCGSFETGCLLFRHQFNEPKVDDLRHKYFVIPIPNSNFYRDAEHFLSHNFDTIRAKYPQMVPPTWPSREQFLKLAGAVSRHFVFGSIAIRFIEDPYAAGNPITRLDQLLALIDEVDPSGDQPFIYVDALYTYILDSVAPDMWPTTKQVLSVSKSHFSRLQCPEDICVTFGTKLNVVDAALNGCYPMLLTPPGDPSMDIIFHASFYGYLVDFTRSKKFSISTEQSLITALEALCNFWLGYKRWCHGSSDKSQWDTYYSQRHSDLGLSSDEPLEEPFTGHLSHNVHKALAEVGKYGPTGLESPQIQGLFFDILGELDYFTVSEILVAKGEFFVTLLTLWNTYQMELRSRGLFHAIDFRELRLDHCNTLRYGERSIVSDERSIWWYPPWSAEQLKYHISNLQMLQQRRPQLQVLIGGTAGGRFAAVEYEYTEDDSKVVKEWEFKEGRARYVIPYSDKA